MQTHPTPPTPTPPPADALARHAAATLVALDTFRAQLVAYAKAAYVAKTTTEDARTPYDDEHRHDACYECEEPFECSDADCADPEWREKKLCNYCFQQHQDGAW